MNEWFYMPIDPNLSPSECRKEEIERLHSGQNKKGKKYPIRQAVAIAYKVCGEGTSKPRKSRKKQK